nr:putative capsid [Marmot picobirnavirus]
MSNKVNTKGEEITNQENKKDDKVSSNKGKSHRGTGKINNRNRSKQPWNSNNGKSSTVTNNASMYYTDKMLAEQVSNFSMSNFLGDAFPGDSLHDVAMPFAYTMYMNPSCGFTNGSISDGVNLAGMRTYTKLSANNAKTTQYAPQDLTILILAIGEVLGLIQHIKRLFGVAYTYNMRNRNYPLGIIKSMGCSPDFVTSGQIAPLRLRFNSLINSFNQIPILQNVEYFTKCQELYSTYYSDSESPMAQVYSFVPYSFWRLSETTNDQGGELVVTVPARASNSETGNPWDNVNAVTNMENILYTLETLIQALLNSSTLNYIYADILRLWPDSLFKVPLLSEDYIVLPEFNPMKLLQINNLVVLSIPSGDSQNVVPVVNSNGVQYLPNFTALGNRVFGDKIINFPHSMGNPDVDQRVDATRYSAFVNNTSTINTNYQKSSIPDHYAVGAGIFFTDSTESIQVLPVGTMERETGGNPSRESSLLSKFDYHPTVYIWPADKTAVVADFGEIPTFNYVFGDLDFYTTIDYQYLYTVNQLAMQGLFEIR